MPKNPRIRKMKQQQENDSHEVGRRVAKAQKDESDHPKKVVTDKAKAALKIGKGQQQSGARRGMKKS